MPTPEPIVLRSETNICVLSPHIGGSIASWTVDGQDMFRRADSNAIATGDPLQMASFPLVPYSNRIGYARFPWNGRQIDLIPNFLPEPHAIHGTGWQEPWAISAMSDNECMLALHHEADGCWPWTFLASQRFEIGNDFLRIELKVTNLSDEPAPFAFGHHPYFDAARARLTFKANAVFMAGQDALPTESDKPLGQFDFGSGGAVAGREIDHCYADWDGQARIDWTGRRRALQIEADMAAAVVYIPKDAAAFCFEPVPHVNNAINRADLSPPMSVIDPGSAFSAKIIFASLS
jgi:aldose 1-epimerase